MPQSKSVNDVYTEYYLRQAGSGFGGVYTSGLYQKGHGIGSFLGGLFRCVFPLLKSGSSAVGSELLKSGVNIISDISRNEPVEATIKKRGKESINNLSKLMGEKMFGSGYKPVTIRKRSHSATSSGCGSTSKKAKVDKKKKTNKDRKKAANNKKKSSKKVKHRSKSEIFDIFS